MTLGQSHLRYNLKTEILESYSYLLVAKIWYKISTSLSSSLSLLKKEKIYCFKFLETYWNKRGCPFGTGWASGTVPVSKGVLRALPSLGVVAGFYVLQRQDCCILNFDLLFQLHLPVSCGLGLRALAKWKIKRALSQLPSSFGMSLFRPFRNHLERQLSRTEVGFWAFLGPLL